MRTRWLALVLVPSIVGVVVTRGELRDTPLPTTVRSADRFARFLDAALPGMAERYRVPGVCVGFVSDGASHLACSGVTTADGRNPVDAGSRFGVASVSKTFAALAVLTLSSRGAFALDDPVERHLTTWHFPAAGPSASGVTIRHLLTHTAGVGVPSYGGASSPAPGETTRNVLDGVGDGREPVTLVAPPGSGFRYSGGGYVVLQLLVEDASGRPFEATVSDAVFKPLGMTDSSFSWGVPRPGDAAGHDVAGRPLAPHVYGAAMAPGAMVTTGRDMLQFVSAFAEGRLAERLSWTPGLWEQFVDPRQAGYGMALTLGTLNGHFLAGHAGTTMGYNAGFSVMPQDHTGWFILENGNAGPFLKADVDRLFTSWKAKATDPRYGVMRLLRAVATFAGTAVACLGCLLLASFALSLRNRTRRWVGAAAVSRASVIGRWSTAVLLPMLVAAWLVFFHTEAFYPAFTTAWLPYSFRLVTAGVALLAFRGVLSCLFVRCPASSVAPAPTHV